MKKVVAFGPDLEPHDSSLKVVASKATHKSQDGLRGTVMPRQLHLDSKRGLLRQKFGLSSQENRQMLPKSGELHP